MSWRTCSGCARYCATTEYSQWGPLRCAVPQCTLGFARSRMRSPKGRSARQRFPRAYGCHGFGRDPLTGRRSAWLAMRSTKQRRFLQRLRTAAMIGHAMPSHFTCPVTYNSAHCHAAVGCRRLPHRCSVGRRLHVVRGVYAARCSESIAPIGFRASLCSRDDRVAVEALRSVVDACRNGLGDLYTLSQAITRPSHGHRIAVVRSEQNTQTVLHEY